MQKSNTQNILLPLPLRANKGSQRSALWHSVPQRGEQSGIATEGKGGRGERLQLTRNFTLEEMVASETARRLSIDNRPGILARANLLLLCGRILQPLRDAWGAPIRVTSGYRCYDLNREVHGAKESQHMQGLAADITVGSPAANHELFQLIIDLDLPFDQLIDEKDYQWIHVSYSPLNRKQILHLR